MYSVLYERGGHDRMPEHSHVMTPPLIQHTEYTDMSDYGYQILLDSANLIPEKEAYTNNFLQKLAFVTGSLPDRIEPI